MVEKYRSEWNFLLIDDRTFHLSESIIFSFFFPGEHKCLLYNFKRVSVERNCTHEIIRASVCSVEISSMKSINKRHVKKDFIYEKITRRICFPYALLYPTLLACTILYTYIKKIVLAQHTFLLISRKIFSK